MTPDQKRSKRLGRLHKVQTQMRQLEEWRLTHLRKEHAELERKDEEILRSLDLGSSLHGLFLEAKVKTLRRNDAEKKRNGIEQAKAADRIREVRRVEKGVERAMEEAWRSEWAEFERSSLSDALESLASRPPASFE